VEEGGMKCPFWYRGYNKKLVQGVKKIPILGGFREKYRGLSKMVRGWVK